MLKRILILLTLAILFSALAGCSHKGTPTDTYKATPFATAELPSYVAVMFEAAPELKFIAGDADWLEGVTMSVDKQNTPYSCTMTLKNDGDKPLTINTSEAHPAWGTASIMPYPIGKLAAGETIEFTVTVIVTQPLPIQETTYISFYDAFK